MALVAKISIHTQQICGLAWSPGGDFFASGGNDDLCFLFAVDDVLVNKMAGEPPIRWPRRDSLDQLSPRRPTERVENNGDLNTWAWANSDGHNLGLAREGTSTTDGTEIRAVRTTAGSLRTLGRGDERHR